MIDWKTGKTLKNTAFTAEPIISSTFVITSDNQKFENVIAALYQDFVLLANKTSNSKTIISFENSITFELIRFKQDNGLLGTPRSLKFVCADKWLELKNSSIEKELELWIKELKKKLNQKGFHDNFQAIKKIGKGGFASVYLVKRKHNNEEIAVKAFSKESVASQARGLESLSKEIKVMRSLDHCNLLRLFQVFETDNSYYLCVQLLSGGSLYDRIKKKNGITSQSIKKIMKCILEGLESMHQNNIMHRDLKPDNILFRDAESDQCLIADFGLGEWCEQKQYIFTRCGTPGYVAPEIANLKNSSEKYSVACDLFSLGVILHMLALKKVPFEGRSYNQILAKNKNCQIDFQDSQYKKIPQSWLDLMKKLLQKDPKKRITASQALDHRFFTQDDYFKEFVERRRNQSKDKLNISTHLLDSYNKNDSNILLSSHQKRNNIYNLREDSCLAFKMKEHAMTGKVESSCENIKQKDSPTIIQKKTKVSGQSRFKCRA